MIRTISDISLDHLLVSDLKAISRIETNSVEEKALIAKTHELLSYWEHRSWRDTETIEITGAKLSLYASPAVWSNIRSVVLEKHPDLANYFLKFANSRAQTREFSDHRSSATEPISRREMNLIASEIDDERVSGVMDRILTINTAFQSTLIAEPRIGDYLAFLATTLGHLCRRSTRERSERATLIHLLAREYLKWQPWDERPWAFLIHGYNFEDAYQEAETVLFETLRRFNSANVWASFVAHLSRFSDRADDYDHYSRLAIPFASENTFVLANRIRSILRRGDAKELPIACDLSGKMLSLDFEKKQKMKKVDFLNTTLLLMQQGGNVTDIVNRYGARYLELKDALDSLIWMAQRFRDAPAFGIMLVSVGIREEPKRVDYSDAAGVLKVIQGGSALDDAIDQGDRMIEEGLESAATRNWLVKALVKRRAEGDLEAALNYAVINVARFENDESRELLSMIRARRYEDIIADVTCENREIDISQIRGIGAKDTRTPNKRFSDSANSRYPLPKDLWGLSTLKRISILLFDAPLSPQRSAALSELETIWRNSATTLRPHIRPYAELLLARTDAIGKYEKELHTSAAKFEYALNRSDCEGLQRVGSENPRLSSLSVVARAVFGDKNTAFAVARYLKTNAGLPPHERHFHAELVRQTLGSTPSSATDDMKIVDFLHSKRHSVEPLIRIANESYVYLAGAA